MWPLRKTPSEPPRGDPDDGGEPDALGPRLAEVRRRVVEIVTDVNRTTERETLAAGARLGEVVTSGRAHIDNLRALLDLKIGSDGADLTRAVQAQGARVRAHLASVTTSLDRHRDEVAVAAAHAEQIAAAAAAIARLTSEARLLALNARIEAARAGDHARGFSVIAEAMSRLSEAIAGANTTVKQLGASLGEALPSLQRHSVALGEVTTALATDLHADQVAVEQDVDALRSGVAVALTDSDAAVAQMVSSSHAALSHLQFQDVCAQQLLAIDRHLHELHAGVPGAGEVAPPVHTTLGSMEDASQQPAGEVLLF